MIGKLATERNGEFFSWFNLEDDGAAPGSADGETVRWFRPTAA
jgi:hypothetical protein